MIMTPLESDIAQLMAFADVPAIALALVRDGRLDQYLCHGIRSRQAAEEVDEHTVFDAAPIVASGAAVGLSPAVLFG
jgi:hypothetical protein